MIKNPIKKMSRREVEEFILKVLQRKDVDFDIVFFTDDSPWAFGAHLTVSKDCKKFKININTSLESDIRCLLLHEMGHLEGEDPHNPSKTERELSAQLWGIERAKELGWKMLADEMQWHLKHIWTVNHFKWNSGYRRYILANKLAKKRGLI